MASATFETPTAFCEHCRHTIERAVMNLAGVERVAVDLSRHVVVVEYEPSASVATIRDRIEGAGFPVVAASQP